jgi:hypothetical protein
MKYYIPSTAIRPHRYPSAATRPRPSRPITAIRSHGSRPYGPERAWFPLPHNSQSSQKQHSHAGPSGPVSQDTRIAAQIIDDLDHWHVHSPAVTDVRAAIDIHRRTGASIWDATILRSAQELGCQILHSEDLDAGQEYDGVEVGNPFPA